MSTDINVDWDQTKFQEESAEDAAQIVEESIKAQRGAIIGLKGFNGVSPELFSLALKPEHAAISLEGEVTMYPLIGRLIEEYFSHSFKTVILVTNGLLPQVLRRIDREPSQLYVSLSAPDKETYQSVCRPLVADGWERLQETLRFLKQLSCPTALRLTLAKGVNLKNPESYANLITATEPTYVEAKGAMAVGFFERRLGRNAMPTHDDIRAFAEKIADFTGYRILDESRVSNVVLLSRLKSPKKLA